MRLSRLVIFTSLVAIAACRPPGYGKHGDDGNDPMVDAPAATEDAPVTDDAPTTSSCTKQFRLDGHGTAQSVWLTGSFVDWAGDPAHGAIEMTVGTDGGWTGSHDFDAGQVQYKFIVDGTDWINDPTNPDVVDDGFGGTNSVFTCVP